MKLLDMFRTRTRHPLRPRSSDIIRHLFADFRTYEVPGDSMIMGEGHLHDRKVYVVAQQKPKPEQFSSPEGISRLNWGMLNADEHSRILSLLRRLSDTAPHEDAYLLSFVDTYGADISMYSALRFQAFFISHLIHAYLTVPIRTVSIVLGEGGSGGALAVQVADRRASVEDALYATAPPESVAAIIFRDDNRIEDALLVSRSTARDLKTFNVVDTIIPQTKKIQDAEGLAKNIEQYLEKTSKELFRRSMKKLMARRYQLAAEMGVMRHGRFYELRRFIERPLKQRYKAPHDIQLIEGAQAALDVDESYDEENLLDPNVSYVQCGSETKGQKGGSGCGAMIPLDEYLKNFQVCPKCGKHRVLDAAGWINALTDVGTFHELFRNMSVSDLLEEDHIHRFYRDFLEKQKGRTPFTEALVTAHASILGYPAVLTINEFAFAGGTMGVVFGEKFRLAVEYALRKRWPVVSVCCSGGARLYEGIVALMQMTKTVAAVQQLKQAGLPFISILADPSTGGAIASYAALGDICLAEPGAMIIFTGPRVMKARGFDVQEDAVHSDAMLLTSLKTWELPDYYGDIRGIEEVVPRNRMKYTVARYLELYARIRQSEKVAKGKRPYYRRVTPGWAGLRDEFNVEVTTNPYED